MDICPCNICHCDSCPYQQYLSCYSCDFDQILNVGSRDLYEHIPSVTMTSVQAIFVLATFVHIRNFSAVTDPTLKVGSWDHLKHIPTVCQKIIINQKNFAKKDFSRKKIFCWQKTILAKKKLTRKNFANKISPEKNLEKKKFCQKKFTPNKVLLKKIIGKIFWLTFGFVWLVWFPHPYSYLGRKFNLLHKPRKLKFGMQVQLTKRR